MSLKATQKEKTRSSYPCKLCESDIQKGEQYMSVDYSDGFRKKLFGAFHINCWKKSPDNPRNKSPLESRIPTTNPPTEPNV